MQKAWNWLKGKKTYIGLAAGGVVVVLQHLGVPMPNGIKVDDSAYISDLWTLAIAAAGRHGISTDLAKAVVTAIIQMNADVAIKQQPGAKGQ